MPGKKAKTKKQQKGDEKAKLEHAAKKAKVLISWNAPEYLQYEKGRRWYLVAGALAIIAVIISLLTDNITMALAIIAFSGVYYYIQTHHPPKEINIRITELGIYLGDMFFPYSHIRAFWIIYRDGVKTLNLRVAKRFHSDVVIQFDGQDPTPVRNYLVGQIPEWEGKEETVSEVLFRQLKL